MHICTKCGKILNTKRGLSSHQSQVHNICAQQTRSHKGELNPHYGFTGKNQYTNKTWTIEDWSHMGKLRKRNFLLKEANYACTYCGYNQRRNNGKTILEIHHIDGCHTNWSKENVCVLCPNCHALTSNYKNWDRTYTVTE
jgi:hypothetical protein